MFHCAILAAHCTYYLHVPPNLGGTFDYTATAPQQIRLYRGAVPPHAPPGYWTPDESNVIAGGIACPINPRITTDAGLTGSMELAISARQRARANAMSWNPSSCN